jgi:pimeloyl-ACP methyl ester carboxylesterase
LPPPTRERATPRPSGAADYEARPASSKSSTASTRTSDQNVVLDLWKPMLDWDLGAMDAAKSILEQLLQTVEVPYLALHGQPVESGYEEWFTKTNPAATIEFWSGMGHWLHLVDPVRFANRIRDFLSQRPEG